MTGMQKLLIYQSMWAMERRRPDGVEWSIEKKLEMIHEAGFDGVGFHDYETAGVVTDFLDSHDMTGAAFCFPRTGDDLQAVVDEVSTLGPVIDHINLQPDIKPYTLDEAVDVVEEWRGVAEGSNIPIHIETHRDRMTTDLFFTLHLLDRIPDLRLTGDLSHYLVGREFAWPISDDNHALMHRIIDNCWGFHGRVASREQVQIQISFSQHRDWVELFMNWWEYGFRSWRRRAPKDATLTFLCELGPREYAMTGSDGYELSDRWQETLAMKEMVRTLWANIEAEDKRQPQQ